MKRIPLLLFFITSLSTSAQFTSIPDVNFEKALISIGLDTGNPDGKVLTTNIINTTYLDVSSKLIRDLTGIQDFVVLKNLYCDSNYLTSLDVSQNVSLSNLSCSFNKITILDISKNINLKTINFSSNQLITINTTNNNLLQSINCNDNYITSLDISKNIEIRSLHCSKNKLTTLDASNNIFLYTLTCNNNMLYGLNLKNGKNTMLLNDSNFKENPNLSCIQVDDVNYSNSKWYNLKDTSASYYEGNCMQYTLIPDVNFETKLISLKIDKDGINGKVFTFDANKTKSLALDNSNSSNKIQYLTGIEDFASLESLNCVGNLLETLDLSNNVALTKLSCAQNKLTNLNISKNIALTELDCYDNKLVKLDIFNNSVLKYLYCHKNQLINLNVNNNTSLDYLWCDFNQLTILDVSKNMNLKNLYCNFNQLTALDVSNNIYLTDLRFSGNKLTNIDITKNLALKTLALESNQVTRLDLSNNLLLTGLHCYGNQLTNIDISKNIALTDFRCNSNKLIHLNLKNGKNTNLNDSYLDFKDNPNLTCIEVDNTSYSNTNWSNKKDTTASFSTICNLGIENSTFDKITIYPNPTNGQLHINQVILEKATIYNAMGQLVAMKTFISGSNYNTIDLATLPRGIYYVYLESEGANTVKKIIVE